MIEFILIENSGMEVRMPNKKNETEKEESFNRWEKRSTKEMIIPEQYQIIKKEAK